MAEYIEIRQAIAGEWRDGAGSARHQVVNPADDTELADYPYADMADIDAALAHAKAAFAEWRVTSPHHRAAILRRMAQMTTERIGRLAEIMTLEQGKPLAQSKGEIEAAIDTYQVLAGECETLSGEIHPGYAPGQSIRVTYEPVGPVLGLAPWNYPHMMPAVKIANALAAGNSVILKPSEETPGSAIAIVRMFEEAGVPPGVIQLVLGDPAEISGRALASDVIRHVTFTGSVPVGKQLMAQAARGLKGVTLELGGHAPVVVCADVDAALVGADCARAKFKNAGQICTSPTRFYVHEDVRATFTEAFVETARGLKPGNGLDPDTGLGPLAHRRRLSQMRALVEDAVARGAQLLLGGTPLDGPGAFFAATVLQDVPDEALVMTQEPFGPVAPLVGWTDLDAVLMRANSLPLGLAAYGFTSSAAQADRLAEGLAAGIVGINGFGLGSGHTPFGGIRESGQGREGGRHAMMAMMEAKTVTRDTPAGGWA